MSESNFDKARFPRVKGRCPMGCGETLFLGQGGYVTCSWRDCPEPDAASRLLKTTLGERPTQSPPIALNLDRLEEIVQEAKAKSLGSLAFSMDTVVIDGLILRIRELENDNGALLNIDRARNEMLRGAEQERDVLGRAVVHFNDLLNQKERELERT